eukprot:gene13410-biopygen334
MSCRRYRFLVNVERAEAEGWYRQAGGEQVWVALSPKLAHPSPPQPRQIPQLNINLKRLLPAQLENSNEGESWKPPHLSRKIMRETTLIIFVKSHHDVQP